MKKNIIIKIGNLELVEIGYLCQKFNINRRQAFAWLKVLRISRFDIKQQAYFSIESLEMTLRAIIETGVVFSMPGSLRRQSNRPAKGLIVVSDKMFKRVCNVQTQATNQISEEVKKWQQKEKELQKARQMLKKARQTIKEINQ